MDGLLAITIVLIVYAVGDLISAKTRSLVPMMFVASVIFMVGFWAGLPTTLFKDAQLIGFGSLMIGLLITHMGTLMNLKELIKQWKTVVIALAAVIGIGIFLFVVGSPIIGREYAIASAPPIAGGVVAALIMGDAAKAAGFEDLAVFATILVVVQGFVGFPVASFCLSRESKRILKEGANGQNNVAEATEQGAASTKKTLLPPLPKDLQTTFVLLAKLSIVALLSFKLAELTGGIVHKYVMCLFMGVITCELGFLEKDIMTKANALGLAMVGLMAVVFASLTQATPEMLKSLLLPIVGSLMMGATGIAIFSSLTGKILGQSMYMSIAIGMSALFGFPGTFILSNEVANANGKTEEERKMILDEILPKMLISGFITVTIASVVLAGSMSKLF
ncbi:MAG TPA: hypothetical protein DC038_09665 [Clostridiales bacterium]|nr:hypothetical protein [Clostridiales bacterium]